MISKAPSLVAGVIGDFEGAAAGGVAVPAPANRTDGRVAQRLLQHGLQTHFPGKVFERTLGHFAPKLMFWFGCLLNSELLLLIVCDLGRICKSGVKHLG